MSVLRGLLDPQANSRRRMKLVLVSAYISPDRIIHRLEVTAKDGAAANYHHLRLTG